MGQETVTLYELNNLVRSVLEQTMDGEYWLEAELSEARLASNGHFYVEFVQKDSSGNGFLARARGTMWARTYAMQAPLFERATGERLRAGMTVRVLVTVEFHELYGYSLNIVSIDPTYTLGALARRRREILSLLEADGILHDNQQLPLPTLIKHVAVISSSGAAGYGDFCDQLQNNEYGLYFELQLFPAVMQGANVESSVLAALASVADEADRWDCVIIIRGGGATSDLSDFDSYALASAVAQMPMPVIVGIGHERDETVLDFVAHTRVKTPTAAAAFLINHGAAMLAGLEDLQQRLTRHAVLRIEGCKSRLSHLANILPRSFALVSERQHRRLEKLSLRVGVGPGQRLMSERHRAELLHSRLTQAATLQVQSAKFKVQNMESRLSALDPSIQLRRGYSLTYTASGILLTSLQQAKTGDTITTRLSDGTIQSQII